METMFLQDALATLAFQAQSQPSRTIPSTAAHAQQYLAQPMLMVALFQVDVLVTLATLGQ